MSVSDAFKELREPRWSAGDKDAPAYLKRTDTKYFRAPYAQVLEERGISNRLLDSLYMSFDDGTVIAGGFMAAVVGDTKDAQDIDLFFTSGEAFVNATKVLLDPAGYAMDSDPQTHWAVRGYVPDDDTRNDVLEAAKAGRIDKGGLKNTRYLKFVHPSRPPIQLIKLAWYDSAEHVLDTFDLTVVQVALDVTTGDLVANPLAFLDIPRKSLVLHRMQYPSSTLRRVVKYSKKGYYCRPGALAHIAQQVAEHIDDDELPQVKTKEYYGDKP